MDSSSVDGVGSLSNAENYASKTANEPSMSVSNHQTPSPSPTRSTFEASVCNASVQNDGVKISCHRNGSATNQKCSYKIVHDTMLHEPLPNMAKHFYVSSKDKPEFVDSTEVLAKAAKTSLNEQDFMVETKYIIERPVDDPKSSNSNVSLASGSIVSSPCEGGSRQLINQTASQSVLTFCPSPSISVYTATVYAEAKQSFTNTEVSEEVSAVEKSNESGEAINSYDDESRKTSIYRASMDSDISEESSSSSLSSTMYKPHRSNDSRWEAIQAVRGRIGALGLNNFRCLRRLGCGDIGSVYLSELTGTRTYFAMKVMDKAALAARKKLPRAQTEREILQSLDHPFLPTLYTHFETEKLTCLVMEFCPGGDLYALRRKRPGKYFPEHAARFYAAEVLLALEYLHMLGIIYRDLKPENVLVREDGHIMLSDFDLSLRCVVCPTLVKSSNSNSDSKNSAYCAQPSCVEPTCVMQPDCIQPACFGPRFLSGRSKKDKRTKHRKETNQHTSPLPELIAEPTSARSMSFVGTHEYLAPEIIKGEGHGSAVDWWTFGIFLYELLFGKTPFKGEGNRATLFNVVGQPLRFPESPPVSFAARDLIRGLLVKEPQHRLAYRRGATEIKQHPFFQSVNWALVRCANPPEVPKQSTMDFIMSPGVPKTPPAGNVTGGDAKRLGNYLEIDFF